MLFNLPNLITISRVLASLAIPFLLISSSPDLRLFAFILFAVAAATDWLDGYLARRFDAVTSAGRILDPIADKLLITGVIFSLALADDWGDGWGLLLFIPGLVILLREIFVSSLREFMAASSIVISVTYLAKLKTTFQILSLGFLIFLPLLPPLPFFDYFGICLFWFAGFLTFVTGFDYFLKALGR